MGIAWKREKDDLLSIRTRGKLALPEMLGLESEIEPIAESRIDLHALVILDHFQGWEGSEEWGNPGYLTGENWSHFSKLAIVGDEKWRDDVMLFTLAGFVPMTIHFFPSGHESEAREWLEVC